MKVILFSLAILMSIAGFTQSTQHFEVPVKEADTLALHFNHHPTKLVIDYISGGLGAKKSTFKIKTVYDDTITAGDTMYLSKTTATYSTIVLPTAMALTAIVVSDSGPITFNIPVLNQLLAVFGLVYNDQTTP